MHPFLFIVGFVFAAGFFKAFSEAPCGRKRSTTQQLADERAEFAEFEAEEREDQRERFRRAAAAEERYISCIATAQLHCYCGRCGKHSPIS